MRCVKCKQYKQSKQWKFIKYKNYKSHSLASVIKPLSMLLNINSFFFCIYTYNLFGHWLETVGKNHPDFYKLEILLLTFLVYVSSDSKYTDMASIIFF